MILILYYVVFTESILFVVVCGRKVATSIRNIHILLYKIIN